MKAPVIFGSLLALAGTATTAESADAAISDVDIPDDLREAICLQDWYEAIELSGRLITSSAITPDYRQTLLGLRHQFYSYAKGGPKPDEIVDCKKTQTEPLSTKVTAYQGPTPRFSSNNNSYALDRYCQYGKPSQYMQNLGYTCSDGFVASATPVSTARANILDNIWTIGARVEGNTVKGTVLNNGQVSVENATVTIRSQQDDQSEVVKTVAIDTIKAWDETDFVATFNHTPGNWTIEGIQVN